MVKSRDQNAGRSHNVNCDNKSSEKLEQFRHLGTTLTNQNSIREDQIEVRRMLATFRCRIFCLSVCYSQI